ncbi:glutaredoxin [Armillaria borealis]|uniref:Glutaredoxin n=1 Tax=Armillaria borealis TaxID=47425 RepID=A0AA39JVU6_9AGAR|nr:glutaredoxin [Armillaria borealis]
MLSRLSAISRYFTSSAAAQNSSNMSVKNFVEDTITSHKITVFSKSYCPYCRRAKTLFKDKYPDADIGVIELDERDDGSDIQEYLRQKTGQGTVPNIFISELPSFIPIRVYKLTSSTDQQHIGGCDDTMSLQNSGKLAGLITA